jgi:chromosome segregation ATPase
MADAASPPPGSSQTLRERVENHPVVFFLTALIAGFVAGLATYQGAIKLIDYTALPTVEYKRLQALSAQFDLAQKEIATLKSELVRAHEQSTVMASQNLKLQQHLQGVESAKRPPGPSQARDLCRVLLQRRTTLQTRIDEERAKPYTLFEDEQRHWAPQPNPRLESLQKELSELTRNISDCSK